MLEAQLLVGMEAIWSGAAMRQSLELLWRGMRKALFPIIALAIRGSLLRRGEYSAKPLAKKKLIQAV